MSTKYDVTVKDYLRPLKLGILFSVLGESLIFLIWGVILYPEGSLLNKFIWTVVICGFGMGSAIGVLIDLFIVGKMRGFFAIFLSMLFSMMLLGMVCNFLCYFLDMHFGYFGGKDTPALFLLNGFFSSALGGILIGWLCFTYSGNEILDKLNI